MARRPRESIWSSSRSSFNPLQFGAGEDLDRYPRDLSGDLTTCEQGTSTWSSPPSVAEMYPSGRPLRTCMWRSSPPTSAARPVRPTSDGVATVVTKLFAITGPSAAFFGRKDAQQLAVIARMVEDLNLRSRWSAARSCVNTDGLALSSRNAYLSPAQRRSALVSRTRSTPAAAPRSRANATRVHSSTSSRPRRNEPDVALEIRRSTGAYRDLAAVETLDGDVLVALARGLGDPTIDNVCSRARTGEYAAIGVALLGHRDTTLSNQSVAPTLAASATSTSPSRSRRPRDRGRPRTSTYSSATFGLVRDEAADDVDECTRVAFARDRGARGGVERVREHERGAALRGREIGVAARQGETVGFTHDRAADHLDRQVEVLDHPGDHRELLGVLAAEERGARPVIANSL